VAEQQILGALRNAHQNPRSVASSAAGRPDSIQPGIRMVEHHDANGLKMRTFHGEHHFTKFMGRINRRAKIRTSFGAPGWW
jgi:hypothetical protein